MAAVEDPEADPEDPEVEDPEVEDPEVEDPEDPEDPDDAEYPEDPTGDVRDDSEDEYVLEELTVPSVEFKRRPKKMRYYAPEDLLVPEDASGFR